MGKMTLVLENVPKDDKSFIEYLPKEGYKCYNRLTTNHPTPYIYVEYRSAELSEAAVEEINRLKDRGDIKFSAKMMKKDNRSTENLSDKGRRNSAAKMSPRSAKCVLCENPAELMCEQCYDPYCSGGCQLVDWPKHRAVCKRMPNLVKYENVYGKMVITGPPSLGRVSMEVLPRSEDSSNEDNGESSDNKQEKMKNGFMSPQKKIPESPRSLQKAAAANPPAAAKQSPKPAQVLRPVSPPTTPVKAVAPKQQQQPIPMSPADSCMFKTTAAKTLKDIPRTEMPESGSKVVPLYFLENTSPVQLFLRGINTREIFKELNAKCKKASAVQAPLDELPVKGGIYLGAYVEDGSEEWYRVLVKAVNPGKRIAQVAYIDYGNSGELSVKQLKEIPDDLMQLPRVTYRVILKGVKSIPADEKFANYKEELTSKVVVMKYDGPAKVIDTEVELHDPAEANKSINMYFSGGKNEEVISTFPVNKKIKLTINALMPKVFTVIESPKVLIQYDETLPDGFLCLGLGSDVEKLTKLETLAEEICEKIPQPYKPSTGELCLGKMKYDDTEAWYRCTIREYDEKTDAYVVYFVDYGNYGNVSAKNIREMLPELLEIENLLIFATVHGVKSWTDEKIKKFRKIYNEKGFLEAEKIVFKENDHAILHIPRIVEQL